MSNEAGAGQFITDLPLCPIIQAPRTIDYEECTISDDSWAGKGLQAKQSESQRAQGSAIQKPDQNRNNMSHSLYNHPYALNHFQLVKWTFDNYEVNIFIVLAIIYHRFHVDK